jgi:hypothetical protein
MSLISSKQSGRALVDLDEPKNGFYCSPFCIAYRRRTAGRSAKASQQWAADIFS